MKFLAFEKENEGCNWSEADSVLNDEAAHVLKMMQRGFVREIYFDEKNCAVLVLECDDKKKAENLLKNFPLVKAGYITFVLKQLFPYTGFKRLINQ